MAYKFEYSILKTREDAENLMHNVFLNLWDNHHKVEKNSSIKFFTCTIIYNSAISIIRKKARETRFIEYIKSLQDIKEDPVNIELEYNALNNMFDEIIDALPQRQKEAYLLHWAEGLKYYEIAERLHILVNTIENHMGRALKTLRSKLGDYSLIAMVFLYSYRRKDYRRCNPR